MDTSTKLFPEGLKEPCGRGRKSIRDKEDGGHKETRPSKKGWSSTYINSPRLWQHAQDLHESVPDGIPSLRGEVDQGPMPKPEAIFN